MDDEPPRIPPKPRYYNDDELQTLRSEVEMQKKQKTLGKTKITITAQGPNSSHQQQIIYPLPRIPHYSRTQPSSGSIASDNGTHTSESGYSSAQTQKTGTTNSPKNSRKNFSKQSSIATSAVSDLIKEGVQYYEQGNYTLAMKSFKSVMKSQMIRKSQGSDPLVAKMLGNIGSIYLQQNRHDHAIESLEKAVRMMQRSANQHEAALAWVLNNLGTAKFLKGDYKGSLECYWQALKDAKNRDGEPSKKDMANAVFNIGRIAILQKDYEMAFSSLRKSLLLETQLYGAKSVESIDTLNMIGFAYYSTERYKQATSIFKEALSIVTANFGSVHEKVAESLVNVGMVLEREGDLKEALRCFSTARAVCEKAGLNERNGTVQTVIRSANQVEEQLRLQSVGFSKHVNVTSPQRYRAHGRAEQRDETHSDGTMDMHAHTVSLQYSRNTPPLERATPLERSQTSYPDTTVRTDSQKVQTYATTNKETKVATDEYREDPYWQYDDSSMVEDDRD